MDRLLPLHDRPSEAVLFHLPGRRVTAAEFTADVQAFAAALPDAPYAINLCEGRYAFAVGFAAALIRGQVSLLASDRSEAQIRSLLARFPGTIAITDTDGPVPMPATRVPPLPMRPGAGQATPPSLPADRIAAIAFTSGSTGTPASHAKSWGALVSRSRDAGSAFTLSASAPEIILGTVPPHHMYGFETTVLLPLHAPAQSWCGPAFYPADVRAAATGLGGPATLVTTPLQLRALAASEQAPSIARVISATAPLAPELALEVERAWGAQVWEIFGATEVGSIAFRRTTAGGAWTPYRHVQLDVEGEWVVVRAPDAEPRQLDDVVERLPDGRFHLVGRRADIVKQGGRRASLPGLNRALLDVPGVLDGAFLPPDSRDGADARMIAVVVAPGRERDAIISALKDRIDPAFLPRRIVHVDRLPRNELGKLPLQALRAAALAD